MTEPVLIFTKLTLHPQIFVQGTYEYIEFHKNSKKV